MNVSHTFVNHYQTKLPLKNPQFDIFLVLIFSILFLLTLKKKNGDYPLSITQANQVKGLAILFIIFNHLCYYTEPQPSLYAIWSEVGMIGVTIFFIFSGYGVCISIQEKGIRDFFKKRIARIFIPLIYALSLLLALYITLMPQMQNGFLLEMPRILFAMESLDGKMWFIVFVLAWYYLLYIGFKLNLSNLHKLFLLLVFSFAIIAIPDMPYVAKGNAFSFPFGCWLGFNHSVVVNKLDKFLRLRFKTLIISFASLISLAGFSFWLAETLKFYAYQTIFLIAVIAVIISIIYLLCQYRVEEIKQTVSLEFISCVIVFLTIYFNYLSHIFQKHDFEGTLFLMYWSTTRSLANILIASSLTLIIALMLKCQRFSLILNFLGWISFELYLIHNTFLIHFDFLLFRGSMILMFPIYFLGVCLISLILKRLSERTLRILRNSKELLF
ncbi:MAG: acyltransferase family protein [Microcoleus sp.]